MGITNSHVFFTCILYLCSPFCNCLAFPSYVALFAQTFATAPLQVFFLLTSLLLFLLAIFKVVLLFFFNLSELCLTVLGMKGLLRAQDMFVAGEIFCPGSHSNRQHQLPEAHCLHTLLLHSFSLFLFSEELLLMSTHQQTKQMGWWKMNN